jgi:hypothetical protein
MNKPEKIIEMDCITEIESNHQTEYILELALLWSRTVSNYTTMHPRRKTEEILSMWYAYQKYLEHISKIKINKKLTF